MSEKDVAVNLVKTWRGFTKRRKMIWLSVILGASVLMSAFVILATLAIHPMCQGGPYRLF